jgi:hypothetical protein
MSTISCIYIHSEESDNLISEIEELWETFHSIDGYIDRIVQQRAKK